MRTPKQIQASRTNGAKSKGPKTQPGKKKSSLNAIKHGLTAASVLVGDEKPKDWESFHRSFLRVHKPQNQPEYEIVLQMAGARWRLRRALGADATVHETQIILRHLILAQPGRSSLLDDAKLMRTLFDSVKSLRNMELYTSGLERSYQRALRDLQTLRAQEELTPEGPAPAYPPLIDDRAGEEDDEPEEPEIENEPKPERIHTLPTVEITYVDGIPHVKRGGKDITPRNLTEGDE